MEQIQKEFQEQLNFFEVYKRVPWLYILVFDLVGTIVAFFMEREVSRARENQFNRNAQCHKGQHTNRYELKSDLVNKHYRVCTTENLII